MPIYLLIVGWMFYLAAMLFIFVEKNKQDQSIFAGLLMFFALVCVVGGILMVGK